MTEVDCPECGSDRNRHHATAFGLRVPYRHCLDCDHVFPAWPEEEAS